MTDWDGKTLWAGYDKFSVGPESGNYKLSVGGFDSDSTVPDDMRYHNGMMFTTYDRDNDLKELGVVWLATTEPREANCARDNKGGWWYKDCYQVHPTGVYLSGGACSKTGIVWWFIPDYNCWYYTFKNMTFTLIPTVHSEPVVTTTSLPTEQVVFLHREDASVNFYRPWVDYRNGFGSPDTNYWMGLDHLHTLTSSRAYGLRVDMSDWDGKTLWAGYDKFSVGPESGNYKLSVGGYDRNSTTPDAMQYQNSMMFTTYDRDNDEWRSDHLVLTFEYERYNISGGNCAEDRKGGWWYSDCKFSYPTGVYMASYNLFVRSMSFGPCNIAIEPFCPYHSFKRMTFTLILQ